MYIIYTYICIYIYYTKYIYIYIYIHIDKNNGFSNTSCRIATPESRKAVGKRKSKLIKVNKIMELGWGSIDRWHCDEGIILSKNIQDIKYMRYRKYTKCIKYINI